VSALKDFSRRLRREWRWVALQFGGLTALVLLGLGWTRLPDKHGWQVLLSLLLPLLIVGAALALQAATMRAFLASEEQRVKLLWGTLMVLGWVVAAWAFWGFLDWCASHFGIWASYLNSKAPAHWRSRVLTYQHIYNWLVRIEWILRWIVTPAKVLPYAMASAQWGWRLHWRRVFYLLWNWRWWLAVTLVALAAVALPAHLFAALPRGTVSHQVWSVTFKLLLSWILILGGWVFLLAWAAVMILPNPDVGPSGRDALATPRGPYPLDDAVRLPLTKSGNGSGGEA
jgi:hypothetical protein